MVKIATIEDHNAKFHKGEKRTWRDDVDKYTDFTNDELIKAKNLADNHDHGHH